MSQLLKLLGNTPLYEIPHPKSSSVKVYAKLEWYNPSGSVKDRAAARMMLEAQKAGLLDGKILIDATSGNTGIAYATYGAALGISVELALPENASKERKLILENFGVKLHLTSAMEGTDGAQRYVKKLVEDNPDQYYYPDQYNNDNNWKAHYEGTGPEIWKQSNESVTHFVAGLGTTGTFVGTSRFLKEKGVHCISVQPDNPMHGLEGWKHMETAIVPGIYDTSVADEEMVVGTEIAYSYAKAATKYLGLLLSPSAAANLVAALKISEALEQGTVVTVFADNGMKYLEDNFWKENDYVIKNPFI